MLAEEPAACSTELENCFLLVVGKDTETPTARSRTCTHKDTSLDATRTNVLTFRATVRQALLFMSAHQIISCCRSSCPSCSQFPHRSLAFVCRMHVFFLLLVCFSHCFSPQFSLSVCLHSAVCGWKNGNCFTLFFNMKLLRRNF